MGDELVDSVDPLLFSKTREEPISSQFCQAETHSAISNDLVATWSFLELVTGDEFIGLESGIFLGRLADDEPFTDVGMAAEAADAAAATV